MTSNNTSEFLMARAESGGRVFRMKSSWATGLRVLGVLLCLLVVGIPFGLYCFVVAGRAKFGVSREGFVFKVFGPIAVNWSAVEALRLAGGPVASGPTQAGVLGAAATVGVGAAAARSDGAKGSLEYLVRGESNWHQIPIYMFENSLTLIKEMERFSGKTICEPVG